MSYLTLDAIITTMKLSVTCLIPAYNEERYIAGVLEVVSYFEDFNEVIVIDDGSSDNTVHIAKKFPVKLIRHKTNKGKAAAILSGIKQASGKLICLLDADLTGLTDENLKQLLKPHQKEKCMTISLRGNAWPYTRLTGVDPWTGERIAPKEIFTKYLTDHDQAGYALESLINQAAIEEKLPIYSINWPNVKYFPKVEKQSPLLGIKAELDMIQSIFNYFGWRNTFRQQILFLYLHFKHLQYHQRLRKYLAPIEYITNDLRDFETLIVTNTRNNLNPDTWLRRFKNLYPFTTNGDSH